MKYHLAAVIVAGLSGLGATWSANAATIAIYTFGTAPGTSLISTDTDASVASDISIGAGLTGAVFTNTQGNPASAYSIPDAGVDGNNTPASNDYFRFTLTPAPAFTLTQISFDASRWDNGSAARLFVSYSLDNGASFNSIADFNINNGSFGNYSSALPGPLTNVSTPVIFQILFSRTGNVANANQLAQRGTYIDNIIVTGTPVPVPAAAWLLGSAMLGLIGIGRRR